MNWPKYRDVSRKWEAEVTSSRWRTEANCFMRVVYEPRRLCLQVINDGLKNVVKLRKCFYRLVIYRYSSYLALLLAVLVGATLFKKPKAPSFQIGSGWNLTGLFFKWVYIDCRSWITLTSSLLWSWHNLSTHQRAGNYTNLTGWVDWVLHVDRTQQR